mgnify:CR=1 FL=1
MTRKAMQENSLERMSNSASQAETALFDAARLRFSRGERLHSIVLRRETANSLLVHFDAVGDTSVRPATIGL